MSLRKANLDEAQNFLEVLAPDGAATFQTFDDDGERKRKDLAHVIHGSLDECALRLQRLNTAGAGVFVTVNETDGKGRTAENVVRVRALFVDLDGAPIEPVRDGPLVPHLVVESSPGRWHAYWIVAGCELGDFRALQQGLIARFGGDKACVDLPRVMRLPGFWHQKAAPFQTRVAELNELPAYEVDDVLRAFGWASPADAAPKRVAVAPSVPITSEQEDVVDDLRDALRLVPSEDYELWIRVGMALKTLGNAGVSLWLEWSGKSAKYDMAVALKRWEGFKPSQTGHAAVFAEAKQHGWDPRAAPSIARKRARRRADAPPPPPPPEGEPAARPVADDASVETKVDPALDALIARFELVYGTTNVWDTQHKTVMLSGAFSALVGSKNAKAWREDGRRRSRIVAKDAAKPKEEDRLDPRTVIKVNQMLPRYALIYGEEAVFDREKRREITLGGLRAYVGLKAVRDWGDHPERSVVDPEQVVFDPRRQLDDLSVCNLWGGWPIEAREGSADDQELVRRWLRVLHYAVGESEPVFDWVLKWIAYPLKYPGSKMKTSVVMHGPEGSGKNTVWDAVRRMYGRYGIQISQTQLEQQWCDWLSARLFIVGNEVLHRQEQVQQKGRLKSIVTDTTVRIERKFINGRDEINFANLVFLSNELTPLNLDPEDRRFLVAWTPRAHPDGGAFYKGLADDSMPDSTVEALYHYFVNKVDVTDFGPHSKPPMTDAKRDLIDASMESQQRFVRDWLEGALPVPCCPCMAKDFYAAYLFWCKEFGERFPKPENRFAVRAKKEMRHGVKRYEVSLNGMTKQASFYIPGDAAPPPDKREAAWLADQADFFRKALRQWKDEQ